MNFMHIFSSPEVILLLTAVLILVFESVLTKFSDHAVRMFAIFGALLALGACFCPWSGALGSIGSSTDLIFYEADGLAQFFRLLFLITVIFVLWMTGDYQKRFPVAGREFCAIPLLTTVGMILVASAKDWTLVFVGLEIVTISFYVLVAYQRNLASSLEAGVKYLIIGALSTGTLVYGIAFWFGTTQSTQLDALAFVMSDDGALSTSVLLSAALILAGVGFKMAAVPFHAWAPDVYQGAPTPVTAYLATGSKAVGVVLLIRLFYLTGLGMQELESQVSLIIGILAAASLLLGGLAALPQFNLKRVLGYSSITHAGFILLGLSACWQGRELGLEAVLIYLVVYIPASILVFWILSTYADELDGGEYSAFHGLGKRSPLVAFAILIGLVSMAGIPPLGGFIGKFAVMAAVWEAGSYWLFFIGLATAVMGIYYYLQVVKLMYWNEPEEGGPTFHLSISTKVVIGLLSAFLLLIGLWPKPLEWMVGWVLTPS
ncbi:MAG: NADH-quinone oxidoreductase subunit N [Verrucomicrobiota bacterium]